MANLENYIIEENFDSEEQKSDTSQKTGDKNFKVTIENVDGPFDGTITLQSSDDDGETWNDVQDFTEPGIYNGEDVVFSNYKFVTKAGAWNSGEAQARLIRERK